MSDTYRNAVSLLPGLRQHLSLQDGATTWTDASGNSHHGTLVGAAFQAGGPTEDADNVHVAGDGVDDRVDATTLGPLGSQMGSGVWQAAFFRGTSTDIQTLAGVNHPGDGISQRWRINQDEAAQNAPGYVRILHRNTNSEIVSAAGDSPINILDGEWHLIVVSLDPGVSEGARIWVDGEVLTLSYGTGHAGPIGDQYDDFTEEFAWLCYNNAGSRTQFVAGDLAEPAIGAGAVLQQSDVDALWAARVWISSIVGLRTFLSGAMEDGGLQSGAALSLGAFRSSQPAESLTARRNGGISGVRILGAGGGNGPGVGRLDGPDGNTLRWAAPGAEFGDPVTVDPIEGEWRIHGSDAGQWIDVARALPVTQDLTGQERVTLLEQFNNAFSGPDFLSGGSAQHHYSAVFLRNDSGQDLTGLTLTIEEGPVRIAEEVPVDDEIQTIADPETQPAGLTWESSELVIGALDDGDMTAVWIEVECPASADGSALERVRIALSANEEAGAAEWRGIYRIEETGLASFLVWVADGEDPDITDTPTETAAPAVDDGRVVYDDGQPTPAAPIEIPLTAPGDYRVRTAFRNAWGITGAASPVQRFIIDDQGDLDEQPPSAPRNVTVSAADGARVSVSALYFSDTDPAVRATEWAIWYTDDGEDPNPNDAPDLTQEIPDQEAAVDQLHTVSDPFAPETLIKIGVAVRRAGATSAMVIREVTTTAAAGALGRPDIAYGERWGRHREPGPGEE